jgi:DNA-binding MarR family transcriptional regulator
MSREMDNVARLRARSASLPVSKQRLRLWLRLLRASRAIEAKLRDRLRTTFDITLPQFDVLAALARHETGMTMTELSRELMVSNGNVTGIIDRLVTEKLVARKALAEDRRTFIVSLTSKGATQFDAMAKVHEQWIDDMLADIDENEAVATIARLDGIATRVREGGPRP